MSLLDTIKGFLGKLTSDIDSAEKPQEASQVSAPPVVKPKPVKTEAAEVIEEVTEAIEEIAEDVVEIAEKVVEEASEVVEKVIDEVSEVAGKVIEEVAEVVEKIVAQKPVANGLQVPEDSTLKRHFLSALKAEIEADMGPRPTDSSLKRHYDAAVAAELDKQLG